MRPSLVLASASPRRRELLTQAGYDFTIRPAELDETPLPGEAAASYVERLAREKASAVCDLLRRESPDEEFLVLAADTCVVSEGSLLGKPAHVQDAVRMLKHLSGRTHAVMTGIAAIWTGNAVSTVSDVEITQVTMNLISDREIDDYVQSGEPMDKAGAYAIQGYAARWIPRIDGDYFNVVGLPIARVVRLLAEAELAAKPAKG